MAAAQSPTFTPISDISQPSGTSATSPVPMLLTLNDQMRRKGAFVFRLATLMPRSRFTRLNATPARAICAMIPSGSSGLTIPFVRWTARYAANADST